VGGKRITDVKKRATAGGREKKRGGTKSWARGHNRCGRGHRGDGGAKEGWGAQRTRRKGRPKGLTSREEGKGGDSARGGRPAPEGREGVGAKSANPSLMAHGGHSGV